MDSLSHHLYPVHLGLSRHFYLEMIIPASLPPWKRAGAKLTAGNALVWLSLSTIPWGPSFGPQASSRWVLFSLVLAILRRDIPQVFGDTSQLMCPLVVKVSSFFVANRNYVDFYRKAIINFAKAKQAAKANHEPEPSPGIGVAMAIGLFLLTVCASIGQHQVSRYMMKCLFLISIRDQFFWRSMVSGVLARAALIKSIYYRSVYLTDKSRTRISNSDIMNHISTDVGQPS